MLDHPARVLWVGTGTKTGKTVAFAQWLIEGIGAGESCAWIGPWLKRTRTGFDHIAGAFRIAQRKGACTIQENDMRIALGKGRLECFSGDNPDGVFGEAFHRVVIDEAGRQPAGVLAASMSTITATNGRLRIAFNLDRGRRHWAIQGFLNAKTGEVPGHAHVFLKTSDSPYVSQEAIDDARRTLPPHVYAALYEGEILEDGAGAIRNVSACMAGELEEPHGLSTYVMGVDLARVYDWTVITVMDAQRRHVVAWDRFHGLPWKVQRDRIEAMAKRYGARVVVDATGVGDPNAEELSRAGLDVEPFVFTARTKRELVEGLIVAIDQRALTFPPELETIRNECDVLEYETKPGGGIGYSAPEGFHDDAVMSLALAYHGCRFGAPSYATYKLPEDLGRARETASW